MLHHLPCGVVLTPLSCIFLYDCVVSSAVPRCTVVSTFLSIFQSLCAPALSFPGDPGPVSFYYQLLSIHHPWLRLTALSAHSHPFTATYSLYPPCARACVHLWLSVCQQACTSFCKLCTTCLACLPKLLFWIGRGVLWGTVLCDLGVTRLGYRICLGVTVSCGTELNPHAASTRSSRHLTKISQQRCVKRTIVKPLGCLLMCVLSHCKTSVNTHFRFNRSCRVICPKSKYETCYITFSFCCTHQFGTIWETLEWVL